MKYIIEIPDDRICDFVGSTHLLMPYTMAGHNGHHDTGLKLTPYTEPDRKAIEDEVWSFSWKMFNMDIGKYAEIFGDNGCPSDYREAKTKYEAWSKQNIREGDEVIYNSRTRAVVLKPETKEKYGTILTSEFATIAVSHDDLEKTGRRFPEVAELLKKMRDTE